jgi:hypothetical protein
MRHFREIAHASASEFQCLVILLGDLGYVTDQRRVATPIASG